MTTSSRCTLKALRREPLFHFLLIGFAIFLLYGLVDEKGGISDAEQEIVVTPGRIEHLISGFRKTWQRPPTESELDALIQEHIREEVLYREALALGLDRDDTIVRRRLRQKIEFLSEDIMALPEPSDEELTAYLQANPDPFRLDGRVTFEHVYLNADERGDSLKVDAQSLLEQLQKGGEGLDVAELGDRFLLSYQFDAASEHEIRNTFGQAFVEPLMKAPVRAWHGPVASEYGAHLVYISERIDSRPPSLDEVRDVVVREWSTAKRKESNEAFYEALRDRYKVTVERPISNLDQTRVSNAKR